MKPMRQQERGMPWPSGEGSAFI